MHPEFWITYFLPHTPPRSELIDLHEHDPPLDQLEDLRDLIIRREVINPEFGLLCRWRTKDGKEMKPTQSIEALLEDGIGTTEETALRLIVEFAPHPHIPNYIWIKLVYTTNPAADVVPKRIYLSSLPGPSQAVPEKSRMLAHLTAYIFNNGYLKWSFLPFVSWKRKHGDTIKESTPITDILLSGEGICDESPLCLNIGTLGMLSRSDSFFLYQLICSFSFSSEPSSAISAYMRPFRLELLMGFDHNPKVCPSGTSHDVPPSRALSIPPRLSS
ncbi:hypothetical protein AX16_004597 [Volvariella volvacea WC 439]|nr:hypothetical protein AX16_004597 [Volvariella volvacea WC 439]